MTASRKDTVFVIDHASQKLAEAIHAAGYQAGALVLWHDRVTPSQWAIDAAGYDIQLRMDTKDSLNEIAGAMTKAGGTVAGIIPTNEPSEEIACRLAERFNVPHNDPDIAAIRWNKAKVKELAQTAGLRVPKFKECHNHNDVKLFARELTYPAIIKPPEGAASLNVFNCNSITELLRKHDIITSTPDDFGNTPSYSVVEEYIGGKEYQVNTFSDGKNARVTDIYLTDKIDTQYASNLYYNEWLINPHDPSVTELVDYVEKVAQATGIKYGPAHIEIKVDGKGPALIEAQARFGGGGHPEMLQRFSNFDPYQGSVEVFCRATTSIPAHINYSTHAAVAYCPALQPCAKGKISGLDTIRKLPSFRSEMARFANKSPLNATVDFHSFPYVVWLEHKDATSLKEDLKKVHRLFTVNCE